MRLTMRALVVLMACLSVHAWQDIQVPHIEFPKVPKS